MKQTNNVQWIFNTITFLLIMLLSNDINSQEQLDKQLLIEKKIENYISKSLKNYSLSEKKVSELEKEIKAELKEHNEVFSLKKFENTLTEIKKNELRQEYFSLNPEDFNVFKNSTNSNREVLQTCTDGNFETWPVVTNPYVFRRVATNQNIDSINTQNLTTFSVGTGTNNFNSYATLVTSGSDPVVPQVTRVLNGSRAIRLNFPEPNNELATYSRDIVTMSRNFQVNQNFFEFNYSVIFNSHAEHTVETRPFFLVRIYKGGQIVRSLNVTANPSDCLFQSLTLPNYHGTILYSGWQCARINTADLMNQNVTVEFIVSDCGMAKHFGAVYIDDICDSNCANPLFGSVDLNPTQNVLCPTTSQTVCGTFQIPANSQYSSMLLNVKKGNVVVGTVSTPSSINVANGTYCFTVPISAFGANPVGDFEYEVVANFTRLCASNVPLDQISHLSANDTGPDVTFNPITPLFNRVPAICAGGTLNALPTTSTNGIIGTWSPALDNTTTTIYTFTPNGGQCGTSTTLQITVNANVIPTFAQIAPICKDATLNSIPSTSTNLITGTWTPALNNQETTTYTFTPNGLRCATTTTMTIVVNEGTTPTFTPIAPICKGDDLNDLPTTSLNSITGIWSPALNNQQTTTYTFTPNNGQCANTTTLTIVVIPIVATNDNFSTAPINTLTGGTTPSVLTNDTLNGIAATSSTVTTTIISITPPITQLPTTIDPNGVITIPEGTTIGSYQIVYKIVDNNCLTNSATATATIVVVGDTSTPQIASGIRANSIVGQIDTQSDGKIIIAGSFTAYNNIPCYKIARLNSNLTYDASFNVSGPNPIDKISHDMVVIKTPGVNFNKILLVGGFEGFNGGSNGNGIIRLHPDGSVDTSFNQAYGGDNKGVSGRNYQVRTVFIFPEWHALAGKILIGGMFDKYNDNPANGLALLNADGSYHTETLFNTNINTLIDPLPIQALPGFSSTPQTIGVQSNGQIIIGGYFTWYNGLNKNRILRLNIDGSHDNTFNDYTGVNPGVSEESAPLMNGPHINKLVVQPDDRIIIAGVFTDYNNVSRNNIARLNANGTLDDSFVVGTGFNNENTIINGSIGTNGEVRDLLLDNVGGQLKVYVCGDFKKYKGLNVDEIIRLDCVLDPGQNETNLFKMAGGGPNNTGNGPVWKMKKQGEKIIIGGKFSTYNSISALNITRIFPSTSSVEARSNGVYYESEPEIDLFATNDIVVYPNPTNGIINFTNNGVFNSNFSISIYNVLGQKVLDRNDMSETDDTINVSDLSNGTYFVKFTDNLKSVSKVIVIKK